MDVKWYRKACKDILGIRFQGLKIWFPSVGFGDEGGVCRVLIGLKGGSICL